jgi:hypothetical protein
MTKQGYQEVPSGAGDDIDVQKGDDRKTIGDAAILKYPHDPHSENRTGKVRTVRAV